MIAVDTNLLVYAHREDSPFHEKANTIIVELAESKASWALPWACIHEFFSIVTHPRIYSPPSPQSVALDQIDAWLESPSLVLLSEDPGYWDILQPLVSLSQLIGPMVHDARIAALCLQHGVSELLSADRDFSRFPELKTRNPLIG